jgi:hypothetical protein
MARYLEFNSNGVSFHECHGIPSDWSTVIDTYFVDVTDRRDAKIGCKWTRPPENASQPFFIADDTFVFGPPDPPVTPQTPVVETKVDAVDGKLAAARAKIDELIIAMNALSAAITALDAKLTGAHTKLDQAGVVLQAIKVKVGA